MSLHEDKMALARQEVLSKAPYFARAVWGFIYQPCPGILTMQVTSKLVLGYDPEWAERATVPQLAADIAHEVLHFVREHFLRSKGVQYPDEWNEAADLAINPDLIAAGWQLHHSAIFPRDRGLPDHLTAEEYYELLLQQRAAGGGKKPAPRGEGIGAGTCGSIGGHAHDPEIEQELDSEPGLGRSEPQVREIVRNMAEDIRDHVAKQGRGSVPAHLLSVVDAPELVSFIPWEQELGQVITSAAGQIQLGGDEYSYRRPAKRSFYYGVFRPSLVDHKPIVAILRDSSGSMRDPQLTRAAQESYAIIEALGIDEVWFADADTAIATDWKQVGADFFRTLREARGRGGTDFIRPIQSALQLYPKPDLLIYLTDGDGAAPHTPPQDLSVIWGIVPSYWNQSPARWGHTVMISDDPLVRNAPIKYAPGA